MSEVEFVEAWLHHSAAEIETVWHDCGAEDAAGLVETVMKRNVRLKLTSSFIFV